MQSVSLLSSGEGSAQSLGSGRRGGAAGAGVALLAPGHCPLGFTPWLLPLLSQPNLQPRLETSPCAVQMVETPLNEMFRNGGDVTAKELSLTHHRGGAQ